MSPPKLNPVEPPWYGPVCPVVWEGRHREVPPYPDQSVAALHRNAHHQSNRATGDAHHTKPLQLDRCLNQTLNEHEFPLRYVDSLTTSKYLMELMLFKSQSLSTCTNS